MKTALEKKIELTVLDLAHQNNMTAEQFLEHITNQYTVDLSEMPRDEEGNIRYEDGKVGIDIEIPDEERLTIHIAAATRNMTTNEFVEKAVEEAIKASGVK